MVHWLKTYIHSWQIRQKGSGTTNWYLSRKKRTMRKRYEESSKDCFNFVLSDDRSTFTLSAKLKAFRSDSRPSMKTSWSTLRSTFISGSSRRPDQSFFFISRASWPWNDSFLSSREFSEGMNSFSLRTNGKYPDPLSALKGVHSSKHVL